MLCAVTCFGLYPDNLSIIFTQSVIMLRCCLFCKLCTILTTVQHWVTIFKSEFLGSALPLYTVMCMQADYTKVNATSTKARLAPGSCTCVRTAFYHVAVIYPLCLQYVPFEQKIFISVNIFIIFQVMSAYGFR